MKFLTKARTLEQLYGTLVHGQVLPLVCIAFEQWKQSPLDVIHHVLKQMPVPEYIVRSSASHEDGQEASLAGHFLSIGHVNADQNALHKAIDEVFEAYGQQVPGQELFVQPMLASIQLSGVAFTWEPSSGAPYWVINYDNKSQSADTVTSGSSNQLRTYYRHHSNHPQLPHELRLLGALIEELTEKFEKIPLDIEFAITSDENIYLLQVRRLICEPFLDSIHTDSLKDIEQKFIHLSQPHPYLHGQKSVFGIMPDWNPAEIIGVRPRPLALTLYQELITDHTWAYQRDNYGYKNLRSFPLLHSFGGCPYIDVRVSFNSFLPANLEPDLSERLVNYYIERLIQTPSLHDKVEFEVIFSCYTLDLNQRLNALTEAGFSDQDIAQLSDALRHLTNRAIHSETGLWLKDTHKIEILNQRWHTLMHSELDTLSKIYWLIEDCKRYGTLPFAGLARAGFIAVQMLKSLVSTGILNNTEYQVFMQNLNTISSQITHDQATLNKSAFLKKYGHLRPGTYDILSKRYDEAPEQYLSDWTTEENQKAPPFTLSLEQLKAIRSLLNEHELELDVLELFDFIKAAIEGREFAKFVFTRHLSDVLALLTRLSESLGLSRDDCSYLSIKQVLSLHTQSLPLKETLESSIRHGKERHQITQRLILPPLLTCTQDIWGFELQEGEPNFITLKRAKAETLSLKSHTQNLDGKILFINSADPGYDWIFTHRIAGLITEFGGANSHMAIRAGELDIPAVIGAGEVLYNRWSKAQVLEMDCSNKQVKILR